MNRKLAGALASAGFAMTASWAAAADVAGAACENPFALSHPLVDRAGLSRFSQMPEHCLKAMYLDCSAASEKVVLPHGQMMACSLGHEALLKRVFRGDFDALLAWWQSHRGPAPRD